MHQHNASPPQCITRCITRCITKSRGIEAADKTQQHTGKNKCLKKIKSVFQHLIAVRKASKNLLRRWQFPVPLPSAVTLVLLQWNPQRPGWTMHECLNCSACPFALPSSGTSKAGKAENSMDPHSHYNSSTFLLSALVHQPVQHRFRLPCLFHITVWCAN